MRKKFVQLVALVFALFSTGQLAAQSPALVILALRACGKGADFRAIAHDCLLIGSGTGSIFAPPGQVPLAARRIASAAVSP